MDKDKDPIISDIKLSPDDLAHRQRQARASMPSRPVPVAAEAPPAKQGLAIFAFILVLVLGAGVAFLYMQLQALQLQLKSSQEANDDQAKSLTTLNDKLSVTGENANLSMGELKAKINEQESEIRKLWDQAAKKNRTDININTKDIATLKTALIKANETLEQYQAAQLQAAKDLAARVEKVELQAKALPEIELRLSQQAEGLDGAQKELKGLKQKDLAALKKDIEQMKKSGIGVDAASIRLQLEDINIRLDRMQNAVGGK